MTDTPILLEPDLRARIYAFLVVGGLGASYYANGATGAILSLLTAILAAIFGANYALSVRGLE